MSSPPTRCVAPAGQGSNGWRVTCGGTQENAENPTSMKNCGD